MDSEIIVTENVLHLKFQGKIIDDDIGDLLMISQDLMEKIDKLQSCKARICILADLTELTDMDQMVKEVFITLIKQQEEKVYRTAALVDTDRSRSLMEIIGVLVDSPNFKIFTSKKEALDWLTDG